MSFVLDNSVALAWCFQDEQTPAVMAVLDRLTETGACAPMLWPLEALNALLVAERRKRLDKTQRLELMSFLTDLPITIDTETAERLWTATAALAERFELTSYDAAYLELAHRRRLPLATLDRQLQKAGLGLGIDILGL